MGDYNESLVLPGDGVDVSMVVAVMFRASERNLSLWYCQFKLFHTRRLPVFHTHLWVGGP